MQNSTGAADERGLRVIEPPWGEETVRALNAYQAGRWMHPFTCREDHPAVDGERPVLTATPEGWICPVAGCDYAQFWAHGFMALPRPDRLR